jgi:galactokinase
MPSSHFDFRVKFPSNSNDRSFEGIMISTARINAPALFRGKFQGRCPSVLAFAPGRANIIGEHVDYSILQAILGSITGHNYAIPFALDKGIYVALKPNDNNKMSFHSEPFGNYEVDLTAIPSGRTDQSWQNYILGVLSTARREGLKLSGGEMLIAGDLSMGGGLSSSAALTCSVNLALDRAFGWDRSKIAIAKLAQRAEHSEYVGVNCGLLDQLASLLSAKNKAVFLDFGNMNEYRLVDLSFLDRLNYEFILVNSGVARGLGGTFYNQRRTEVEMAGRIMERASFGRPNENNASNYFITDLAGETARASFLSAAGSLAGEASQPDICLKRALHVLEEKARTPRFEEVAKNDDIKTCCDLIAACGVSLSMEGFFQASATVFRGQSGAVAGTRNYLDMLRTSLITAMGDCDLPYGFRMMGGGGGGYIIGLAPKGYLETDERMDAVNADYDAKQRSAGYGDIYSSELLSVIPSSGGEAESLA